MRKGFTLLELVIVVIIVAVLAGLGIPQFIRTVERAKAAEGVSTLGVLRSSQIRYYAEYGTYTSAIGQLDITIQNPLKNFSQPSVLIAVAGGNVANVVRSGSLYTLNITDTGNIVCVGASCPAGF